MIDELVLGITFLLNALLLALMLASDFCGQQEDRGNAFKLMSV